MHGEPTFKPYLNLCGFIKNWVTSMYVLAIRQNLDSVRDMKKHILATNWHTSSTEEDSKHKYCPPGSDSWGFWQKAVTAN